MAALGAWFVANVWPNLVASAICAGLVWWRARIHLARHKAEAEGRHLELFGLHNDAMDAHNRLLERHDQLLSFLAAPPDSPYPPPGDTP